MLVAAAVCLGAAWLLWPQRGLIWRWWRSRRATERVLIEHALKHLYDCEYARIPATVASLAGALETRRDGAARLTERLESMGLVAADERTLLVGCKLG